MAPGVRPGSLSLAEKEFRAKNQIQANAHLESHRDRRCELGCVGSGNKFQRQKKGPWSSGERKKEERRGPAQESGMSPLS